MISVKKNRDKLLGVAAIITFLMAAANALEYFVAGKNYLARYEGRVSEVRHEMNEQGGRHAMARTEIYLQGVSRRFTLADEVGVGGYVDTKAGDTLTLYARHWFQLLYNFSWQGNLFFVERNRAPVYNNLDRWKASAFYYGCVFGGCALFLLVMYLDQVKNISVSNLFRPSKREGVEGWKRWRDAGDTEGD